MFLCSTVIPAERFGDSTMLSPLQAYVCKVKNEKHFLAKCFVIRVGFENPVVSNFNANYNEPGLDF